MDTMAEEAKLNRKTRWMLAIFALVLVPLTHAQVVRWDQAVYTLNTSTSTRGLYPVLGIPGATAQICSSWTTSPVACTVLATTYTDSTGNTPCNTSTQLTPDTGGSCTNQADTSAYIGAWLAPGCFAYIVTTPYGGPYGPYQFCSNAGGAYLPLAGGTMTGPAYGKFYDKGAQVFNAKSYGCAGDGVTDDTTCITNMITAYTSAGGGILFFPQGNYLTATCNFSITKPGIIEGVGQKSVDNAVFGSMITCTHTSNNLFNVATDSFVMHDIALSGPTSGSETNYGVYFNGPTTHSRFNAYDLSINGFKDAWFVNAGAYWSIRDTHIINPIRYGVNINNVLNNDEGDWRIDDVSCVSGSQTNNSTTPGSSACIGQFSSGGGKISGIKSNTSFTHGYYGNLTGSVQLLMVQNDIEATANAPIYFATGWPYVTIVGNFLNSPCNYPVINATTLSGYVISDNDMETTCVITSSSPPMVLSNAHLGTIGPNHFHPTFLAQPYTTGSGVLDYSNLVSFSAGPGATAVMDTVNIGCSANGCGNNAYLNFLSQVSSTPYNALIQSTGNGNGGLIFNLPRDLAASNIGYHFQSHAASDLLYIDSSSGDMTTVGKVQVPQAKGIYWNGASGDQIFSDGSNNLHIDASNGSGGVFVSGNFSSQYIAAFRTTPAGSTVAWIDPSGNITAGAGANTVYRCATAGATLPAGSLTINASACGSTTDTGLRVK